MKIINEEIDLKSGLVIISSGIIVTLLLAFALSALKILNPGIFSNIVVAALIVVGFAVVFYALFRKAEKTKISRH